MTRLPADGGERKPLRRRVEGASVGPLIVDLTERTVTLRPRFARRPEAIVRLTWEGIYVPGLMVGIEERRRARKRRRAGRWAGAGLPGPGATPSSRRCITSRPTAGIVAGSAPGSRASVIGITTPPRPPSVVVRRNSPRKEAPHEPIHHRLRPARARR